MCKKLFVLLTGIMLICSTASADVMCVRKKVTAKNKISLARHMRVVQGDTCPEGYIAILNTQTFVGPQGEKGEKGTDGLNGEKGEKGDRGENGTDGLNFYDVTFLPGEQTLTGVVSGRGKVNVSLQVPAGVEIEIADPTECTGTYDEPTAPYGKVCVYPMYGIAKAQRIPTAGAEDLITINACEGAGNTWFPASCITNKADGVSFIDSEADCAGTWDNERKVCVTAIYDKAYCELNLYEWDTTKACFVDGRYEGSISSQAECEGLTHHVGEWREKGCRNIASTTYEPSYSDKASCLAPKAATWVPGICSVTEISTTDSYSNAGFAVVSPRGEFAARWAYTAPELF